MPSTRSLLIGAQALAVAALLVHSSGSPVAAQQRDPAGLVKADAAVATFAKDVAPIFQKNCQQCHQSGAIGPMPLTTFEEVRPWARAIKQKVVAGEMPPYRYDREVGIQKLKNDLRLSPQEIQTIARWVDNGAPLGNPADLPPPVTFPDANKWGFADQFGPPDIVIRTKPFTLQARGQDVWWRPIVPTGLTKDRCLKAVSVKPSVRGRAAAHHANSDLLVYDEKQNQYVDGERLTEYALGKVGEIVPLDSCRTIPANSMVRWDVHYYPIGKELEDDVIEMGLWLYPEGHQAKHKQDLKLYSLLMKGGELEIPPNGTAMTQGFHTFKTPVRIDSFQPHGHFRLVGKTLEIFYPETGKLEMISSVSNWTNSWHTSHIYDDDAAPLVPKGAVLVITGYYDNTAGNKQNPDPDQWVGLGSRTADEMSHAWIAVTHLDDETYQRLVAEREQRKKNATEQRSAP
ncbi:MAG TPA: cytochrome c [Vicinamibacterales bacterium]|jgi:mono/diheme cytochrome c family protein|nr:cytochrome c [Vicinamibacterales bacterium]